MRVRPASQGCSGTCRGGQDEPEWGLPQGGGSERSQGEGAGRWHGTGRRGTPEPAADALPTPSLCLPLGRLLPGAAGHVLVVSSARVRAMPSAASPRDRDRAGATTSMQQRRRRRSILTCPAASAAPAEPAAPVSPCPGKATRLTAVASRPASPKTLLLIRASRQATTALSRHRRRRRRLPAGLPSFCSAFSPRLPH